MADTTLVRHKVAFVAHSYGSHLQKYINVIPQRDPDFHLAQADVSWCFKGGWTWEKFWADPCGFVSVYEAKPDVIFIQLGGNDLDSHLEAHTVANYALDVAAAFLHYDVQLVILGEVLHRKKTRHIAVDAYNNKVDAYNTCLRDCLLDGDQPRRSPSRFLNPNIWQWDHLRLHGSRLPLLRDDGVHLTDHPGNSRLYWSVRLAYKQAIESLP